MVFETTKDCNEWHVCYDYAGSVFECHTLSAVNKGGGITQHRFRNILQDAVGPK